METSESVDLEDLGLGEEDRVHYEAAEWRVLRRVLSPRDVGDDDVFVDLGAGKGRVVLRAAEYPFKRVELSGELSETARANVMRNAGRLRCRDVRLVTADATDYDLPDDVSIVFLNNPFRGRIFGSVVANIITSADRCPRRLRIIYRSPAEEA